MSLSFKSFAGPDRRQPRFRSLAKLARLGAAFAPAMLLPCAAATATPLSPSAGCSPLPYTSGDLTCVNTGTITTSGTDGIDAPANGGNATTTNSGTINSTGIVFGIRTITNTGNASTTNSGTINVDGSNILPVTLPGDTPLFGSFGSTSGISTSTTTGDAITVNSGNVRVKGFNGHGIQTNTTTGNATVINSGNVSVVGTTLLFGISSGPSLGDGLGQNVGIASETVNGNATVINSGTVSVTGPNNVGVLIISSGASLLINSGTISAPGGIAVQFVNPLDPDTLTLEPGSFIVGAINLIGAGDTVNVNAGNQNLTFNSLAGATVGGNVPFVVSGNRIASVDPTGFAVTDRSLMDFTRAISASLGGRVSDADAGGGGAGAGGALGFAAYDDSAARVDDAFAQVMGYAKAPDNALVFKNPTMTTPDGTTVWAKGFYGQRTQQADGPILRSVTNFYGGAIGVDRLAQPDLRLGGLVGGGAINSSIDLNSGGAASDVVFAGLYGRKDFGPAFIDFALLGGHTGNRTTRNINNNLLANGLEIASASFGGWFFSPEVAAGYRYDVAPGWTVTPAARLRYLTASYDGFTETGSTSNLTAGGRTLQNAEERADLTLTRTMLGDAGRFQVGFTVGALGQQRTGSGTVNAILLGQALAFATPGKSSISGGYAGTSLDWRMRNGLSLFAAAEYTAMSDSSSTITGKAGLRYGF
jgi:outer membrane autotransporter protein